MTVIERWRQMLPASAGERAAALWSFAYFFTLLAGYYVLRPLRDQMGIAGGIKALPWVFTATFVTLLVAQPIYGALVARVPRVRFIPLVYHFFVANLVLFWLLMSAGVATVTVARIFFVWVSVFNLFAVVVFWSFMADLFTAAQGKRLFGFIGAGGTAGALLGPAITIGLSVFTSSSALQMRPKLRSRKPSWSAVVPLPEYPSCLPRPICSVLRSGSVSCRLGQQFFISPRPISSPRRFTVLALRCAFSPAWTLPSIFSR
jgi:MFS family permease